ncbi:hypothetical protein AJ80_10018, partial [Polytolypa hystricis UAMH7299]
PAACIRLRCGALRDPDTQEPEDDGDSSEEADEQANKEAGKTQDRVSPATFVI